MAGNGEGGRGTAASKKRQGTKKSKAKIREKGVTTGRSGRRTSRALELFLNRDAHIPDHVYLAEVVKGHGSHMDVLTKDGDTETVRISGSVRLPRSVFHKIDELGHDKAYVIVDGGGVVGNVPNHLVAQVKKRVGWPKGSRLDTIFEKNENNGGGGGGGSTRRRSRR
jgi:hypothetical protein